MLPLELVELIIYHAWGCLSTSSHRHGFSMTQWMLVNRDWLSIVISVVFRDLWVTTPAHMDYIHSWLSLRSSRTTFIFELAGIPDVREHLCQMCRSLTISVYHTDRAWYTSHCSELHRYASATSRPERLVNDHDDGAYAVPSTYVFSFAQDFTPRATSLHFVLIDCNATYGAWDTTHTHFVTTEFPYSLRELHITFAYTSPPPTLLLDAPRGTFFPPSAPGWPNLPLQCWFGGVRKLVIWDANADFVAFMTTACPHLERVETTLDFRVEDLPTLEDLPTRGYGFKFQASDAPPPVFVRLPRTETWGLTGTDTLPASVIQLERLKAFQARSIARQKIMMEAEAVLAAKTTAHSEIPIVKKKRNPIWRLLKRVFTEGK
ncbi:hypothetical protein GGX14DRAFT_602870 [Mycena pura]|uniref:Uncharacterized protein n=1 Tax=Mycena pura TaxID=153505 RepID=A0AAD6YIX4_9AGAR|nr:hypothetical protein GGX14DRAFT_602870 [Mycena pura]